MLTSIDYIALAPIGVYWLGLNGVVVEAVDDVLLYPSSHEARSVLENV